MALVFHSQTQLCRSWRQLHKLDPLPVPESKHLGAGLPLTFLGFRLSVGQVSDQQCPRAQPQQPDPGTDRAVGQPVQT